MRTLCVYHRGGKAFLRQEGKINWIVCIPCRRKLNKGTLDLPPRPKTRRDELHEQMAVAGDRRDWHECNRLEAEMDKLNYAEGM